MRSFADKKCWIKLTLTTTSTLQQDALFKSPRDGEKWPTKIANNKMSLMFEHHTITCATSYRSYLFHY
jgi:hypothetical protein